MFENLNSAKTQKISFDDIPKWSEDDHLAAFKALLNGEQKEYNSQNITTMAQAKSFFEQNYKPYKIKNVGNDKSLYTGYFEPKLKASATKTDTFRYPLYGIPMDLDHYNYYLNLTRESLTKNIQDKLPILAWLDNKIDLYFMHIQGSGLLEFVDGTYKRYVYAGKNNFQYSSIGKYLTDNGIISSTLISMSKIKDWLREKEKNFDIIYLNKSFIFFKEDVCDEDKNHPIGQLGIRLSPYRSLAVDMNIYELNTLIWLNTKTPAKNNNTFEEFNRLMVAQDQGSAIKGLLRGDIYFGSGLEAGKLAGNMKAKGNIIILKKKNES
jgi:membrane-bound lytic murein transglycosylase A